MFASSHGAHLMRNDAARNEMACFAYEMRIRGCSYREIQAALREHEPAWTISHQTVARLITEELARRPLPRVEEFRKQQMDQIAIGVKAIMVQLHKGQNVAKNCEALAKLDERMSKLLGADAAEKVDINQTVEFVEASSVDDEIERLTRELGLTAVQPAMREAAAEFGNG